MDQPSEYQAAISDFHRARSQASLKQILSLLTGRSTELLSFEEVQSKLKLQGSSSKGLQDIPLDAIVGSVNRYADFTRDFLPRQASDLERWARVKLAFTDLTGPPPIEVYQIDSVYFVRDGNHRVSVARQLGARVIQAYVTEVRTRVPLSPQDSPDDLIIKAEYADFLEQTHLDELRPDADLTVTGAGQYPDLLEHIQVHRYYMGLDLQRDIPYPEAVAHWYDEVYLPVVQIIRAQGILQYFPGRTETDLYLWIARHRSEIEEELGWKVQPEQVASDLVDQYSPKGAGWFSRLGGKLVQAIGGRFESGPPPGQWRKEKEAADRLEFLFPQVLVPVSGQPSGWSALEQAIVLSRREQASLHGLHVVAEESNLEDESGLQIQAEFNRRCEAAGVPGQLFLAVGEVARQISSRARWADLVVTNLAFPPPTGALSRMGSGFQDLVQRCPRPILAVPAGVTPLSRPLLAYDGSPKAQEALYVAAYLAGRWGLPLSVVTIRDNGRVDETVLEQAGAYLHSRGVQADLRLEEGPAAGRILSLAEALASDFLLMGGYGANPVAAVVLGGVVDEVLRASRLPLLICR